MFDASRSLIFLVLIFFWSQMFFCNGWVVCFPVILAYISVLQFDIEYLFHFLFLICRRTVSITIFFADKNTMYFHTKVFLFPTCSGCTAMFLCYSYLCSLRGVCLKAGLFLMCFSFFHGLSAIVILPVLSLMSFPVLGFNRSCFRLCFCFRCIMDTPATFVSALALLHLEDLPATHEALCIAFASAHLRTSFLLF